MASTTLITFMLQAPISVYSVEILGSWDNFSKSYQLRRDRRTGPGHWRGCHKFENITCDGDTLDTSQSRDGGLKMGGTYWYYYVLDGDVEYHDPAEPSTNLCPLLPGQMVNVLNVPMQSRGPSGGSHNGSTTSVDSLLVFTLDPKDKYLPPGVRRAATTSAIQKHKAELAATTLKRKLRAASTDPQGTEGAMRTGQLTLERQRSLLSMFDKMRQTRSAGSNAKSGPAWPRKLFSRSGSGAGRTAKEDEDDIPEVPKTPSYSPSRAATATRNAFELPVQRPETPPPMPTRAPPIPTPSAAHPASLPQSHDRFQDQSRIGSAYLESRENDLNPVISALRVSDASPSSSYFTPLEQRREHNSYFIETSAIARSNEIARERIDGREIRLDVQGEQLSARNVPLQRPPLATNAAPLSEPIKCPNTSEHLCPTSHSYAESSSSSYAISDDCSPYLDSNIIHSNPMSPLHLSQPETPVMSDFEDDIPIRRNSLSLARLTLSDNHDLDYGSIRPPSPAPPSPPPPPASKPTIAYSVLGFHGYSLPNSENASVLTIKKPPSTTFKPADTTSPFIDLEYLADVIN